MSYQPSEIVELLLALAFAPVIVAVIRRAHMPHARPFLLGYAFMTLGWAATVLEGFVLPDLFNTVEHASYAAAGWVFAYGVWKLYTSGAVGAGDST